MKKKIFFKVNDIPPVDETNAVALCRQIIEIEEGEEGEEEEEDEEEGIEWTGHVKLRQGERVITNPEILAALRGGQCIEYRVEKNQFRYQIGTNKIRVIVLFTSNRSMVIVTAWWRKKK